MAGLEAARLEEFIESLTSGACKLDADCPSLS